MNNYIPLSVPNFEGNELKYVIDAVGQGWVSTGGAYITDLEKKVAEYVHTYDAVACQSGTSALHLSLIQCGVKQGELVIAPTLTFIAAVNPIMYLGAEPIFMDCDDSLCLDPLKLKEFCLCECYMKNGKLIHKDTNKIIRALIVVHVFGNMADMESIMDIANEFNLKVVEDATEAIGTRYISGKYKGKYAGTIGDFGAYSFNGNKIITTGGGGMVVAKSVNDLQHIRYISTQAKDDIHFYIHNEIGYNYRMTNVQAAIGVGQMECLSEFIERKNRNYDLYAELIKGNKYVELLTFREGTYSNKWFYALKINKKQNDMYSIVKEFEENGIQTRTIWGLIDEQKPYLTCFKYKIENAKKYSECILNLPCSTNITLQEIEFVYSVIKRVLF